jgi:hypothetical protein
VDAFTQLSVKLSYCTIDKLRKYLCNSLLSKEKLALIRSSLLVLCPIKSSVEHTHTQVWYLYSELHTHTMVPLQWATLLLLEAGGLDSAALLAVSLCDKVQISEDYNTAIANLLWKMFPVYFFWSYFY